MYVAQDRFDEPLTTEGYHARRTNDLEDEPVPYVDGMGAGMVAIIKFSAGTGATYEQTEPVGDNWHRYRGGPTPLGTVRPS